MVGCHEDKAEHAKVRFSNPIILACLDLEMPFKRFEAPKSGRTPDWTLKTDREGPAARLDAVADDLDADARVQEQHLRWRRVA